MAVEAMEVEGAGGGVEEVAHRLLHGDLDYFVRYRRKDIPELLHVASSLVTDESSKELHLHTHLLTIRLHI